MLFSTAFVFSLLCSAFYSLPFGQHADMVDTVDGVFVLPKSDTIVSQYLRDYGQFEKPLIDFAISLIKTFNTESPAVVLDIGANLGVWSVPLAKAVGPTGKVYAFEAQRLLLLHLSATSVINSIDNIYPVHGIVGNASGFAEINDFSIFSGSFEANFGALSILGDLSRPMSSKISSKITLPVISLDEFYATQLHYVCPTFLKLDIEHYELFAFMGAKHMLLECHPIILFEANCPLLNKSLFLLLEHLGYQLAWLRIPVLDHSIAFQGKRQNLSQFMSFDELQFNVYFFGAINVLAVPKTFDLNKLVAEQSHAVFPINTTSGRFRVEEYNLGYCIYGLDSSGDGKCGQFYMHMEPPEAWNSVNGQRTACGGANIPDYLVDYWKRF